MPQDKYRIIDDQFKRLILFPDGTWSERVIAEPPADMATSSNIGTRRLAVDSQQTSFEENRQFRLFFEFGDIWSATLPSIPTGQQLVLKFTSLNALNVFVRRPELHEGGFAYRVFRDNAQVTFTGTLAPLDRITPVNGNLQDTGLPAHPVTGVTTEWAIGAGIFRSTDWPRNGTVVKTDGNVNRNTNNYSPNDERSGVAANGAFWLVMDSISQGSTKGMLTIMYEEIFP